MIGRHRILYRVQNLGEKIIFRVLKPVKNIRGGGHQDGCCTDAKPKRITFFSDTFWTMVQNAKYYTKSAITFEIMRFF